MKHLLVALLLLAALLLTVTYYVGGEVDRIHRQLGEESNPSIPLAIEPGEFDRGLLSSNTSTRLVFSHQIKPALLAGTTLDLNHRIVHGPLPLLAWLQPNTPIGPAQTVIQTQVDGRSTLVEKLGLLGSFLPTLKARTWVKLNGVAQFLIQLPAETRLNEPTERLQLTEFSLSGTLPPGGTMTSIQIMVDSLEWCRLLDDWACLNLSIRGQGDTPSELHASGEIEITKDLLISQLTGGFLGHPHTAEEHIDEHAAAIARRQAERQIALLVNAGILQEHQKSYQLRFSWDAPGLELNGKPRSWYRILPVISLVGAQLIGEV